MAITLTHGVNQHTIDNCGGEFTVADLLDNSIVLNALGLNGTEAFTINGKRADSDQVVEEGDIVQFSRTSGDKGR